MPARWRVVVGVDPGYSGGVAAIREGEVVLLEKMPLVPLGDARDRDTIDQAAIDEMVSVACRGHFDCVSWWTEDCWGMPRDGAKRAFGFGGAYHSMIGSFIRLGVVDRNYVPPKTWQKALFRSPMVTIPRPDRARLRDWTKAAAAQYCGARWPGKSLVPDRCRVIHTGLADALCIASYGWDEMFEGGAVPAVEKTQKRKTRGMRS